MSSLDNYAGLSHWFVVDSSRDLKAEIALLWLPQFIYGENVYHGLR